MMERRRTAKRLQRPKDSKTNEYGFVVSASDKVDPSNALVIYLGHPSV